MCYHSHSICAEQPIFANNLRLYTSHFLKTMRHPRAGSSTNKWMRIVHNRALDLGWLLAPVLARKVWPAFRTKKGIPITLEQHRRLVLGQLPAKGFLFPTLAK
jgi:hypothetical protein